MTLIEVEYHGVHTAGPEGFTCVLLRWSETGRVLPIWITPLAATELEYRDTGMTPRRPGSIELLGDVIEQLGAGLTAVHIISHFEGVFIASLVFDNGEEIDARPSDALALARAQEVPIRVEEDVLAQASFFVSADNLRSYLGVDVEESGEGEGALENVDAEFEQMMRRMGVEDSDLFPADERENDRRNGDSKNNDGPDGSEGSEGGEEDNL